MDIPDIDIYSICTPPNTHDSLIERLIINNKHLLCEKPLSLDLDNLLEFERLSNEKGLTVMGGYIYKFSPSHIEMKEFIEANQGHVDNAYFRIASPGATNAWQFSKNEGGGAINELFVHMMDLANWYFGPIESIEEIDTQIKKGYDTNLYTTPEIERIGRVAFDMARARNGKVTSVEKANVMMSGVLWREVMVNLHEKEGTDIKINHMYADNCAMQLVRDPKQFDVIVTDNLFGDILSDCAAMLTGSLGMLPSASLGSVDQNTGKRHAMYEPVHGSAPDIAGKELANPLAELLSLSMLFLSLIHI